MTALAVKGSGFFAFGTFVLIPERQLLMENGAPVKLGRRAYGVLLALVEHQGEVVSKRDLIAHGWPDLVVDEGNLKVHIAALRAVLGDISDRPRYIATIAGRGYKFVAAVQSANEYYPALSPEALAKRPNNLPISAKRLFGRSEIIASLGRELETSRLVSIVGPGGIGKTTVALAVADAVLATFHDGAWLIDFSSVTDDSDVLAAIASPLGIAAEGSMTSAAISDYLRDRKILLVLDNCERVLDEVAGWADRILRFARHVKLLTTSREPLSVKGERVRRLPALGFPPAADRIDVEEALYFPAVHLFVDRATQACPSFVLDDTNVSVIVDICSRLDGLALAIERVARRVETHSVDRMLDHIDNRFHMYDSYHAGPERHRTLTAAVASSYVLLSETERTITNRLSTLAGAFDMETACAIGADGIDRMRAVEVVAGLVSKSLLLAEATSRGMRYRQTNITRAFAHEKLIESGELHDTRRRHAQHFLQLASQAPSEGGQWAEAEWRAVHGGLIRDIRAGLRWAFDDPNSAELAVRLALATTPFWLDGCDDGAATLQRALQCAEALGHREFHLECQRLLAEIDARETTRAGYPVDIIHHSGYRHE